MNFCIEFFRLIAVILITFTHTRNDFNSGFIYFVFEELPQIGTILLSLISGYLFIKSSNKKTDFYKKKINTLLIPYLIANLAILFLVILAELIFKINFLNRLNFDYTLITEGLFALNSPPVNPPTYFIRDLFIVFTIVELIKNKNLYVLIILIPLLLFGNVFLRIDIPIIFGIGSVIGYFSNWICKYKTPILSFLLLITVLLIAFFTTNIYVIKYPISLLIFLYIINKQMSFFNVGAFTYLLHLYHSPIMVVSYPILSKLINNEIINAFLQVLLSILFVYLLFLLTRKFPILRILTGQK